MWRRISSHLQIVSSFRTTQKPNFTKPTNRRLINSSVSSSSATKILPFQTTSPLFSQHPTTDSDDILSKGKKTVEDVMPIATGHEREEIEAELQGRNLQEMDYPEGPFGTKEAPAIVKSTYDKRIVGCPGGEDEDEHDVVWFWLEKGKPHECPVCSQYFVLEVVGPGGSPDGHDDHDHHAHH